MNNDEDFGPLFQRPRPVHQPPKFDSRAAADARNASMEEVEDHAKEEWKEAAHGCVLSCAKTMRLFTADDVQLLLSKLPVKTHDNRALGPILREAQKSLMIRDTEQFTRSTQVKCHRMPRRIWESLIYEH
jgi:hypothetical protein